MDFQQHNGKIHKFWGFNLWHLTDPGISEDKILPHEKNDSDLLAGN